MAHAASAYDMVMMIHVVPFMVDAAPVIARLATLAAGSRTPLLHSMMGTLPGKAEWFADMERAGVPMFNDVEEMAEAAGLLARYPRRRDGIRSDNLSDVRLRDRRGA
jgi:acyl-CoA synthetase (NDP forming)